MNHNHMQHFCLIDRNWKVICCEFQIAETMSSRVAESSKVLKQFNQFQSVEAVQSVSKHFIFPNHSFLTISASLPVCTLFLSQVSSRSLSPAGSGDIIARTWMTYIFWYEVYLGLTATNPCYFGWYIKGRYTSTNGWSISFRWMITLGDN